MSVPVVDPLRIAIISTPRSGNTWTRKLLCHLFDLQEVEIRKVEELADWDQLPPRCGFVLHWSHRPDLQARLERHRIHALTLARHPFDVLVSILHFAQFEPNVPGWMPQHGPVEKQILGVPPCGPHFLRYACGPKAVALIDVSTGWWRQPFGLHVRYEDLVDDPRRCLKAITQFVGVEPAAEAMERAIAGTSIEKLRTISNNNHFWKGQPGTWKRLLCAQVSEAIAAAHATAFQEMGYRNDPDPTLTAEQANANWYELIQAEWWAYIRKAQTAFEEVARNRAELAEVKRQLIEVTRRGPLVVRALRRLRRVFTRAAA